MAEQGTDGPKIIVDSDWKSEAQAEKQRLEKEVSSSPKGQDGDPEGMPPADFRALVGTLVTQSLMYMGGIADPQTGRAVVSLDHARFHIDLLSVLEEKTRGNIEAEESTEITQIVSELRMRFVELTTLVAEQAKKGGPGNPAGPGSAFDIG